MSNFEAVLSGPPKGLNARVLVRAQRGQVDGAPESERVAFGQTTIPAVFDVEITPDPWPDSADLEWGLVLTCRVIPGGDTSEIVKAVAVGTDLVRALDHVKKRWSVSKMKTWAHAYLILGLPRKRWPASTEFDTQPTDGLLFDRAMTLARTASPQKRRRTTVTDEHLKAVAGVYSDAPEKPTMAVARHFHASHSTAARWVGLARKAGLIPPAKE